jgi:hypothetical protein
VAIHLRNLKTFLRLEVVGNALARGRHVSADGMTAINYALLMTSGLRGGVFARNHYARRTAMTSKKFNYTRPKMGMWSMTSYSHAATVMSANFKFIVRCRRHCNEKNAHNSCMDCMFNVVASSCLFEIAHDWFTQNFICSFHSARSSVSEAPGVRARIACRQGRRCYPSRVPAFLPTLTDHYWRDGVRGAN